LCGFGKRDSRTAQEPTLEENTTTQEAPTATGLRKAALAINRPDKDDANVPHTYARSKRKARLSDHSSHLLHSDSVESEEGLVAPDFDDESGADVDPGLVTTNTDARSKKKARLSDSSSRNGKRVKQISPEPPLHGNSDSAESEEQLGAPDFDDESGADVDSETAFFIDIDDFAAPAITAFHKCCKT
jgi:hypothetical protein